MAVKTIEERFMRARSLLITRMPFFASLVLAMDFKEVDPEEMMCPTMGTDGKDIVFAKEYVEGISEPELLFVLCHEALHAALGHCWRRGGREPMVFNVAADYVVNQMIDEVFGAYRSSGVANQFMVAPKGTLLDKQFADMSVEEVYRELMKNAKQIVPPPDGGEGEGEGKGKGKGSRNRGGQGQGESSGKIVAPNNHEPWEKASKVSEAEQQHRQLEWRSRLMAAGQQMKAAGLGAAGLERVIGNLRRPLIDWRQALQEFIVSMVTDYGFAPPDHRIDEEMFGVYMPSFSEEDQQLSSIMLYADASGSMGTSEIVAVVSEVKGIVEQYRVPIANSKLFWFDGDVVDKPFDLADLGEDFAKLECLGGGGTDFGACARHLRRHMASNDEPVKCVLMLTDGYADVPPEEAWGGVPVIWLLTTPPERVPEVNYGRVLYVDPESLG